MKEQCKNNKPLWKLAFIAIVSAFWLLYKSGLRPTRIRYPCQQVALVNIRLFNAVLAATLLGHFGMRYYSLRTRCISFGVVILITSTVLISSSTVFSSNYFFSSNYPLIDIENHRLVPLTLEHHTALSNNTSNLFVIQNASDPRGNISLAVLTLIELMDNHSLNFYSTNSEDNGLIANDDVIILKVNSQWPRRGGTNTDLVKSLIEAIIKHPDGFEGEIIIADNGQGLGSLDYSENNAFNHTQSMEDVADSFSSHKVSTVLWDYIRDSIVDDFHNGDFANGYIYNETMNPETQTCISYPKFTTIYGTHVSFKNGVWINGSGYLSESLKVINIPVLKSHQRYGVTACVKHFMGVVKGQIHFGYTPHEHWGIAYGGMGTIMANTRYPVLNILDAIWINGNPVEAGAVCGPMTSYSDASFTNILCASTDPIALDYWAAKNILMPTAEFLNHTVYNSLDPDFKPVSPIGPGLIVPMVESFHNYLTRTMNVLLNSGFQVTMNMNETSVFTVQLNHLYSSTTSYDSSMLILTLVGFGIPGAAILLLAILYFNKKKNQGHILILLRKNSRY